MSNIKKFYQEVEAVQYDGTNDEDILNLDTENKTKRGFIEPLDKGRLALREEFMGEIGYQTIRVGDWVIHSERGTEVMPDYKFKKMFTMRKDGECEVIDINAKARLETLGNDLKRTKVILDDRFCKVLLTNLYPHLEIRKYSYTKDINVVMLEQSVSFQIIKEKQETIIPFTHRVSPALGKPGYDSEGRYMDGDGRELHG